jgi:Zinc finger, C3HC4 type (RING finger)
MDARTKVAAATASVVPFHCIICFQEFCVKERPPVVLPCGHTFLCAPCSKRLKRCMECREPLYITIPHNKPCHLNRGITPPPPSMYSRPSGRQSPSLQYPSTPPQAQGSHPTLPVQIPLPIPKNVVLISMIEASERHHTTEMESRSSTSETGGSMDNDEEEEYDLNQIISGLATFSGSCGTYAVRDSLILLPDHPKTVKKKEENVQQQRDNDNNNNKNAEEGDEEEKKLPDHHNDHSTTTSTTIESSTSTIEEPVTLQVGQTIQVVEFEHGVAKLARGAGFVVANSAQLVKSKYRRYVAKMICSATS